MRHRALVVALCSAALLLLSASVAAASLPGPPAARSDGTLISVDRVSPTVAGVIGLPPGERMYTIFYWSRGVTCQAYLDVPAGTKARPLLVVFHGGFVFGSQERILDAWGTLEYAASFAQPGLVTFVPSYAGYGPSAGSAGTAHQDYKDVLNGLKALSHVRQARVDQSTMYAMGDSLGGGLALMFTADEPAVRAAAVVSPWTGATETLRWLESVPPTALDPTTLDEYGGMRNSFGSNVEGAMYRANSIVYSAIRVPVLVIGGTHDPTVQPAMLKYAFAHLKQSDPAARLLMVPGGHVPQTPVVWQAIHAFFAAHGLQFTVRTPALP